MLSLMFFRFIEEYAIFVFGSTVKNLFFTCRNIDKKGLFLLLFFIKVIIFFIKEFLMGTVNIMLIVVLSWVDFLVVLISYIYGYIIVGLNDYVYIHST